jgi:plasmid stabilization system protein ParE
LAWTAAAAWSLERLYDFLAKKDPESAARATRAVHKGSLALSSHPEIGRLFDDTAPDLREWIIPFGNSAYVLLYRYDEMQVTVLAIRHGREAGY